MELVISPVQDEAMALGVGGVHEVDPQEEAMAPSPSGVHEAIATLDVTNPLTPTIVLCHEVGNKGVKEIVDQMLEGDGLTTKHLILLEMLGDMQLLDPTEGNGHDYAK
jgi:hypothetical protein